MTDQTPPSLFSTSFAKCKQISLWLMKWGFLAICGLFLVMLLIDQITSYLVRDKIYTDLNKLPTNKYAVVLGTAKFYTQGSPNLYYKYRLEAAHRLIKADKVEYLLVSGDNRTPYYNEPKTMTNDLRRMGIENRLIKQDFAGYRTLDSIVRADKVYQVQPFTIVSQKFHCERALFIAKYHNINAVCYVAEYPQGYIKVRLREFFARTGMVLDYLIGTKPETLEDLKSK